MQRSPRVLLRVGAVTAISITSLVTISVGSNAGAAPGGVAAPAPVDGSATDQIIVTFDRPGKRLGLDDLTDADAGARAVRPFGERGEIVKLAAPRSGAELEAVMQRLARRPGVELVEPDQIMHHQIDDALYGQMWSLAAPADGWQGIDVEGAWSVTTGDPNLRIAVIDTGIVAHADLATRTAGGYDFISDTNIANDGGGRDADPSDPGDWITSQESRRGFFRGCPVDTSSWHGTHVAGTIGAATDNEIGIAGINQQSTIVPVRVLGKCGGYTSDIVDGMRWSAGLAVAGVPTNSLAARVLSLSLGGSGACSATYQDAVDDVTAAGAVVVVAAGNSNADAGGYSPASCNGVVTVAATGKAGNRSYYSNFGSAVEIAAPGGDRIADSDDTILSTLNTGTTSPVPGGAGDTYVRYQGTSMATPHVSGVVSLMLSSQPGLSPAQVTEILQSSAREFPGGSTCTNACGAGLLDAGSAVAAAASTATTTTSAPPPTTATTVPAGVPGSFLKQSPSDGAQNLKGAITFSWSAATNATGYQVCLDAAVNGGCDGAWQAVGGTSARASGLQGGITYEWQVRAVNASGSTEADAGEFWTFSTR
jgi:serine protease